MGAFSIWHILVLLSPIFLLIAFAPTIIAIKRNRTNKTAIVLLNLLAGWTGIGWIVALIWSVLEDKGKLSA